MPTDADDPDGLVFTDRKGRRLMGCGRPAPPGEHLPIAGHWTPPSGERLDWWMATLRRGAGRRLSDR